MNARVTRADLERRLSAGASLNAPLVGEITARQAVGVLAVLGVVVAYLVRGRIVRKNPS